MTPERRSDPSTDFVARISLVASGSVKVVRRRPLLWAAAFPVCVVAFASIVAGRAAWQEWTSSREPPQALLYDAGETGIAGMRDVSFESATGDVIRGWLAPSRNGAAVILAHGSSANRAQLLFEARALTDAGFGVLAFDWPGQGESSGRVEWGRSERSAVTACADFLQRTTEANAKNIGAFGFSNGGYFVAQVAATDARLRAIALAATPADFDQLTRWEHRRWGFVSEQAGVIASHYAYGDQSFPSAAELIAKLSPRPLLSIQGGDDSVVPGFMQDALFNAAQAPKERLLLRKAGHGDFWQVAPRTYQQRLVQFFTRWLGGETEVATRSGAGQ